MDPHTQINANKRPFKGERGREREEREGGRERGGKKRVREMELLV